MRAPIVLSALWAALALATPGMARRAVVTNYHTEVVTEVVTVRAQRTRYRPHGGRHSIVRTITLQPQPLPETTTVIVDPEEETTTSSSSSSSTLLPPLELTFTEEPSVPEPTFTEELDAPEPTVTLEPSTSEAAPEPTVTLEPSVPQPDQQQTQGAVARPGADASFKEKCLFHHNEHRRNHSAPALVWDDALANAARVLAETCVFDHDRDISPGGYSQNLAVTSGGLNAGELISEGWYNSEFRNYRPFGFDGNGVSGHLTAMLWKESTKIGCAAFFCANGIAIANYEKGNLLVCNYNPMGNFGFEADYKRNVLPPLGNPILKR